jgi:hypothetical protein
MRGSIFQIITFIESIVTQEEKEGTEVAVRKAIPHSNIDLPPLVSVEATGVCIPIGNRQILLAAVYKSLGRTWSDADIAELLSLRHKCILAGDLNAKQLSWNSTVSNPSGEKLLLLFDTSDFDISVPQCPTHYSPVGNGDILDIFHILDHIRTKNVLAPLEKITD